jgi:hypothetical protein
MVTKKMRCPKCEVYMGPESWGKLEWTEIYQQWQHRDCSLWKKL